MNQVSHIRVSTRPKRTRGTWADYEREKRQWQADNPTATYEEHERACRAIARRLGI